jgi:hypothetical protein
MCWFGRTKRRWTCTSSKVADLDIPNAEIAVLSIAHGYSAHDVVRKPNSLFFSVLEFAQCDGLFGTRSLAISHGTKVGDVLSGEISDASVGIL